MLYLVSDFVADQKLVIKVGGKWQLIEHLKICYVEHRVVVRRCRGREDV